MLAPASMMLVRPMPMAPNRLRGWLEIAKYLDIHPRTAQRYVKNRALPVQHFPQGGPKSPVFAIPSELDAWMEANASEIKSEAPQTQFAPQRQDEGLAGAILSRIGKFANLVLYRRNYVLHVALRRTREGVRVNLEYRYEVVNATDTRQPFRQELTIDDPDHGYVEEMSFFANKKPVYVLKRPSVSERCIGYSIYRGPELVIERNSIDVIYECRASWIINRSENDFWCNHMMMPTMGIAVETNAPQEFTITRSFTVPDLLMAAEHIDIAWNCKRSSGKAILP
jgi:hypothetical protein